MDRTLESFLWWVPTKLTYRLTSATWEWENWGGQVNGLAMYLKLVHNYYKTWAFQFRIFSINIREEQRFENSSVCLWRSCWWLVQASIIHFLDFPIHFIITLNGAWRRWGALSISIAERFCASSVFVKQCSTQRKRPFTRHNSQFEQQLELWGSHNVYEAFARLTYK